MGRWRQTQPPKPIAAFSTRKGPDALPRDAERGSQWVLANSCLRNAVECQLSINLDRPETVTAWCFYLKPEPDR